ncbi:glycosyltransferase family 39 protein [Micromonospora sp. NPDC049523]|uniref:glycosyltransferase family 39 protein n=1 Tax=Micromonospora sp. NPDC049523 TaxID=3155921 RepID=UPI00344AB45A
MDAWDRQTNDPDIENGLAGQRLAMRHLSWLLPTLLMAALALVRPNWPGQRASELDAWGFVLRPWHEVWPLLGNLETTSVPYYLGLRVWAEIFGSSDFALRLPAILAMVAATALLTRLGSDLLTPRVGFLAGILFAILPTTSRYAQEIGPQALSICFAVLATFILVRLFDRPSLAGTFGYGVTVVLLGLVSAPALALLAGHAVAVLTMRRRIFVSWLVAVLVSLVIAVGFLYLLRPPKLGFEWTSPVDLPEVTRLPQGLFGLALLAGIVVGLGLLSFSFRKPAVIFTTWAVGPVLVLYVCSQFVEVWDAEALLFTLPAWTLLVGTALLRAPVVRGVFTALLIALLAVSTQVDVRARDGHGQDDAQLAAVLAENLATGDVIVYGPGPDDERTGRDLVARYLPANLRPRDALMTRAPRTDGHLLAEECVDVAKCLGGAPRVWLLRVGPTEDVLAGLPAAKDGELRTRYVEERTWRPTGLTLTLFTLAPAAPPAKPATR